ncbi:MAG: hypothetical protein WKF46_08910 [Candidatus Limnocylindrales bacterium]|jgi:hypothetical protein
MIDRVVVLRTSLRGLSSTSAVDSAAMFLGLILAGSLLLGPPVG